MMNGYVRHYISLAIKIVIMVIFTIYSLHLNVSKEIIKSVKHIFSTVFYCVVLGHKTTIFHHEFPLIKMKVYRS